MLFSPMTAEDLKSHPADKASIYSLIRREANLTRWATGSLLRATRQSCLLRVKLAGATLASSSLPLSPLPTGESGAVNIDDLVSPSPTVELSVVDVEYFLRRHLGPTRSREP